MARLGIWVFLTLLLLGGALATGSGMLYRLVYVLLAIPLLGYGATLLSSRGISGRVERATPQLQVGAVFLERITVRSRHWWPKLLLEVEHHAEPTGTSGRVVTLMPYQSTTWVAENHCDQRGLYTFGTLSFSSRDPLGLVSRTVRAGEPQSALVHPATVELLGFRGEGVAGVNEGVSRDQAYTPTPIASGVREHGRGDSFSRIHWPTTLRTGKLMVKEFEEDTDAPKEKTASEEFWVVLDLWEGAQSGVGADSTVEYGVTIAASIAKALLEDGRSVGLVAYGDTPLVVKTDEGSAHLTRVLDALALAQPGRHGPLLGSIAATVDQLTGYATVLVISPGSLDDLGAAALALHRHGAQMVPIYLDAASFRGAPSIGARAALPQVGLEAMVVHQGDDLRIAVDLRAYGLTRTMAEVARGGGEA